MNDAPHGAWAVLLDFDGTLVDIANHPDDVVVPEDLVGLLLRLQTRLDGALALVSGRSIPDIDRFMAPHRFDIAALHGAERRVGDVVECQSDEHVRMLRPAVELLSHRLGEEPGVLLEDKGAAIAVHWRMAPTMGPTVATLVEKIADGLAPEFRLQLGKSVAEIAPANADKGRAIKALLTKPSYTGRRPVFIGDDVTDHDGFAMVQRLGGIAVHVGKDSGGKAPYFLADPTSVRQCLATWAAGMPIDPVRDFHS
jgi:trehalose 6-phosphate phosphatase